MPDFDLNGVGILIVEDEYMLAIELAAELADAGAVVIGPAGTVKDALAILDRSENVGGAVVDINLHGDMAYPVADVLADRAIPFVFTTGYDAFVVPARFEGVPRCEKPVGAADVVAAIRRMKAAG